MNWKTRAHVLNVLSAVPNSDKIYRRVQRLAGQYRKGSFNPLGGFQRAVSLIRFLEASGFEVAQAKVMEIGTGTRLYSPLTWWLCGMESMDSYDIEDIVDREILKRDLQWLRSPACELRGVLAGLGMGPVPEERLNRLPAGLRTPAEVAACIHTRLLAPGDGRNTGGPDAAYDVHTSCNTLEHICEADLDVLFVEAFRVLLLAVTQNVPGMVT